MYSTLSYLTRKANFKQVNPDIPITQVIPDSEPPEVFAGTSLLLRRFETSIDELRSQRTNENWCRTF